MNIYGIWLKKIASSYLAIVIRISKGAGVIALVFLLLMMVVTVVDVFLRYFFSSPIKGSVEVVQYCMVVAGFLGIAWCAVKRGHVKVDLILSHLPPRIQGITDTITLLLAMTVAPLVAWQGFAQARLSFLDKQVSMLLKVPEFPFYAMVGAGYSLLVLVLFTILAENIAKALKH